MNSIRKYAKKIGHQIIGKLTRHPEFEYETDWFDGSKKRAEYRVYSDEGGNEYYIGKNGVCIVTADDAIL